MVAFSKMLAAGVVASFGVAGVSAKQGNDFASLLADSAILAKMPAGKQGLNLDKMIQDVQNKTPEEMEEMEVKAREIMYEMMDQMNEGQADMMAQAEKKIDEMEHWNAKSEGVQKTFDAELQALKDELEDAERVKDEFGNSTTVDASKIADLKAKIAQFERDPLFKQSHKKEIATQGRDAAGLMKSMVNIVDVVKKTTEEAMKLPAQPTEEEKAALNENLMGEMDGVLEQMTAAVAQMQSHMTAEQKEQQAEMLQKMKESEMAPMADMINKLLKGEPLSMNYLEEGAQDMINSMQEHMPEMQQALGLAADEAQLKESVLEEVVEEAAEEDDAHWLAIKEHKHQQ